MRQAQHQYIERETGEVHTERLYQDGLLNFIYNDLREHMPAVFRLLISGRTSKLLGQLNYDLPIGSLACRRFMRDQGMRWDECVDAPAQLSTLRAIFERKIKYWQYRPLPADAFAVVSPADARLLVGSFRTTSRLCIKDKFFEYAELIGGNKPRWAAMFEHGDFALMRLTPDKYHYNHVPVDGIVEDYYEIDGGYHACNPGAVVAMVTPFSKNRRVVTIIDTDVAGGTGIGRVAMIEVVALMIGDLVQCYSETEYHDPKPIARGMMLKRGAPKSLYRPGSSTTVLLFEPDRIRFAADIVSNQIRADVSSRFSFGFGHPLVETDIKLRSAIAWPADAHINSPDEK